MIASHPVDCIPLAISSKVFGRTKKERNRRKKVFFTTLSWVFVGTVVCLVVLLAGEFISRMWIKPPVDNTIERTDMLVRKGERIQVTVMNGCGQPKVASKFTDYLRARKFDVVEMTNYKRKDIEHTFVIDKIKDTAASQKVAYALGIELNQIVHEVDSNAFVDAAVVIGKDFQALNPMK